MKKILIIFIQITISISGYADSCRDWFDQSNIKISDKNCLTKCNLYPKDMNTFSCSNECENLCKTKKCKRSDFWKKKIKNGKSLNWPYQSEVGKDWSELEKESVINILDRLPESFKKFPLVGLFRLKQSVDIINPGTTSADGHEIAIYDRAFGHPNWSTEEVIFHELGHVVFESLTKKQKTTYRQALGWSQGKDGKFVRNGEFISSSAKDSVEEDFAENLTYILLDPAKLKKRLPAATEWFSDFFKNDVKLKKEVQCE